jgi:hypothetical protein
MHRSSFRPQVERLDDRCLPAFVDPVSYAVGATPYDMVSGDFNNDGRPDLAVATSAYPSALVSVLLGNADGTFQPAVASAAGSTPGPLAVGDFDGDGKLDLATADNFSVRLLRGNGDGTFALSVSVRVYGQTMSVAVGDFNSDGLLDLGFTSVSVSYTEYDTYTDGFATVLLGDGAGGLTPSSTTGLGSGYPGAAAVGDFNGDRRLDFVCVQSPDHADGLTQVRVLFGDGNGHIGPGASYYSYDGVADLATGDVDGDADADLVMAVPNRGVAVLRNDGAGGFGPAQFSATGNRPAFIAIGDFNNDSRPDVAASGSDNSAVLLGLGNGTSSPPIPVNSGPSSPATAGDFNGDGWLDLATTGANVSVLLNDHNWPNPLTPTVSVNDVTITEGNTGTRAATFTATLSAASSQPVTVAYATANGTATAGSDYLAASGTLTFAPGETSKTITVLVKGDRLPEPNETFVVNLSSPTNATIADGQGVGTIVDDEPRISIGDVSKKEGKKGQATSFTFTVTLSAAYDQPVTMSFRTADGTAKTSDNDYVAKTGTLTFAPGQTTKTITIIVNGDSKKESNEYFYLDLFGNSGNSLFTKKHGLGTILNDD